MMIVNISYLIFYVLNDIKYIREMKDYSNGLMIKYFILHKLIIKFIVISNNLINNFKAIFQIINI